MFWNCTNQGKKMWYLCYHSVKYPVVEFQHVDDVPSLREGFEEPNANSTLLNPRESPTYTHGRPASSLSTLTQSGKNESEHNDWSEEPSYDVGHISHIPRKPPTPTTYTVPSMNKLNENSIEPNNEDYYGMIKLKDTDVCYTNGSIEWVGRKRSYPLNYGFKIINDSFRPHEPSLKKVRRLNNTYTFNNSKINACDCADVLPTVNAMVDHLNALHEAVDLLDLRLNNLEDVYQK